MLSACLLALMLLSASAAHAEDGSPDGGLPQYSLSRLDGGTLLTGLDAGVLRAADTAPPRPEIERADRADPVAAVDSAPADPDKEAPEGPEGVAMQSEITARSRRTGPLRSSEVLTSANVIGGEQLQNRTTSETLQLMKRFPGVSMEDYNQGVTTSGLSIRGFNTQGDVASVKLLIDGVPSNFHVGTSELKSIFPLEIDRIELVKGTNDPRYGLNNVAGNINVFTRHGEEVKLARLQAGSFSTVEPQLLLGSVHGPFQQTYFVGYRTSQGFRDNARMDRLAGSGKWFVEVNRAVKVGIIARAMRLDAEAPGYLRRAEARRAPRSVAPYANEDSGEQRNLHLSAHADVAFSKELSLQGKAYVQSFLRDRYVRFDASTSQQLRREDEQQQGGSLVLTYRARSPRARGLVVEWGADYQRQDNHHLRANTIARRRDGASLRDQDFTFHAVGSYVQASVKPIEALRLVAGVRADYLDGELQDRVKTARYDLHDYGVVWQPKAAAVWTLYKGLRLYANYGRTFQVDTGVGAYATGPTRLAPSRNDGWEAGVRSTVGRWATTRVAIWQQLASREVRLRYDNAGETENVGKTERYGLDLEGTFSPLTWLSVWGSFSPVAAKQTEPGGGATSAQRRGKTLNHVPWYSAKVGIDYTKVDQLFLSLWAYAQGDYYLTKENEIPALGGYAVVNLDVRYTPASWLELGLSIENLLNTDYDASIWYRDFGDVSTQHSPGAPFAVYASAALTL